MVAKKRIPNPGYDIEVEEYDADTIPVFCKKNRISGAFYYKMKLLGKTPREMHLGKKRLISREAAKEWREKRQAEASVKIAAEVEAAKTEAKTATAKTETKIDA